MGVQRYAPAASLPGKTPGALCIGGWVGPSAGTEDLAATGIRSADHRARIPTELFRPTLRLLLA